MYNLSFTFSYAALAVNVNMFGFHACIKTGWDGILVHMIYVQKSNLLNNKHNKTLLNSPQIIWVFIASKNPSLAWKCARLSSSLQGWNLWFGSQREIIYGMYGGPETSGALRITTTSANRKILQKHTKNRSSKDNSITKQLQKRQKLKHATDCTSKNKVCWCCEREKNARIFCSFCIIQIILMIYVCN